MRTRRVVATVEIDTDLKLSEVKRALGNGAWPAPAIPVQVQVNLIKLAAPKKRKK